MVGFVGLTRFYNDSNNLYTTSYRLNVITAKKLENLQLEIYIYIAFCSELLLLCLFSSGFPFLALS